MVHVHAYHHETGIVAGLVYAGVLYYYRQHPTEGNIFSLFTPGRWGRGTPSFPTGGGGSPIWLVKGTPIRTGWGIPLSEERGAERALTTWQVACLLRSRKRTFLFRFFYPMTDKLSI